MLIHMSSRFTKLHLMLLQTVFMSLSCKLSSCHCICISQIIILQTVPCPSGELTSVFLQTIILQTVIYFIANCHFANYVFSFQHWTMKYDFITCGAKVDLRSFPSVRAHFNELSFKEVSRDPTFQ